MPSFWDYAKMAANPMIGSAEYLYRNADQVLPDRTQNPWRDVDPTGQYADVGQQAAQFAGRAQRGYQQTGQQMGAVANRLGALATGQESLSQTQLAQALARNQAQQRALAASAGPRNASLAARNAMANSARLGSALSGQAAMAGIAERDAANRALGQLLAQQRAQDLQATLGGRNTAANVFGGIEGARTGRFGAAVQTPTSQEQLLSLGQSIGTMAVMSDARNKASIKRADREAQALLRGLQAYSYDYKHPARDGLGRQYGVMAQDLEKSAAGRATIINTPRGKIVDGAKLALALAGAASALNRRLDALEQK